jgi:hypothetical protein
MGLKDSLEKAVEDRERNILDVFSILLSRNNQSCLL